jgi:hypothetical protein
MREITRTAQRVNEPRRRWFTHSDVDLYVWEDVDSGRIVAYQLCYDKRGDERVVHWNEKRGFGYAEVRELNDPLVNATPTFHVADDFDPSATLTRLKVVRGDMDAAVFQFVHDTLAAFSEPIHFDRADWTEYTRL